MPSGIRWRYRPTPARERTSPRIAASPARSTDSSSSWRTMRPRLAPSDVRSATSRARAAAPTRSRLPALVAATAITTSPATMNGRQPRRAAAPPSRRWLSGSRRSRVPSLVAGKRRREVGGDGVEVGGRVGGVGARGEPPEDAQRAACRGRRRPATSPPAAGTSPPRSAAPSDRRRHPRPSPRRRPRAPGGRSRRHRAGSGFATARSVRTTAGSVPGISSSAVRVRPARAATPAIANALADSDVASTRSGRARRHPA